MRSAYFLLLAGALSIAVTSCNKINGKGDAVTETRTTGNFTGVSLAIDATVYIKPDSVYSVKLQAQQNILDIIETSVEGGHLVIRVKNNKSIGRHDPIIAHISSPVMGYLNISGSGAIHVSPGLDHESLDFSISGSGDINVPSIHSHELRVHISGSGSVRADEGIVDYENLNISGSGSILLAGVAADTVFGTISGSGDIEVTADKLLDGTISGSGNIRYHGSPVLNSYISGSGSITHF